jgi:SpoVK/Ycf46/Vps4 family AAA+-type ATPase
MLMLDRVALPDIGEENAASLTRNWMLDPAQIAASAVLRLWQEQGYAGKPLLFHIESEPKLQHPALLDKVIMRASRRKRILAEHLQSWELLEAPAYAGEIGALPLHVGIYDKSLLGKASIYDKKTVPGPLVCGWFAYHFSGWDALAVFTGMKNNDESIGFIIVPEDRLDAWLAFQIELRRAQYGVLKRTRKARIDILGSPEDGQSDIREEIQRTTFDQVILEQELIDKVLAQRSIFQPNILARYASLRVPRMRKVLLIGPPGTGKTTLTKALAAEHARNGGYVVYVFADDDERRAWRRFQHALETAAHSNLPTLIIVEDLENFVSDEKNMQTVLNTLDGVATPDNPAGTLLLATTNAPERIDKRITQRPGRIDMLLEVPAIKNEALAVRFFQHFLGASYIPSEHDPVAKRVVNQVGSHVREVCILAAIHAVESEHDAISRADVEWAHDTILSGRTAAEKLETCDSTPKANANLGFGKK